jgi:hypothetical protein
MLLGDMLCVLEYLAPSVGVFLYLCVVLVLRHEGIEYRAICDGVAVFYVLGLFTEFTARR